jgi:hypothetical protein
MDFLVVYEDTGPNNPSSGFALAPPLYIRTPISLA